MENKILQQNDYNALQLSLPIDLGIKIDEDDMVVSFLKALEGVNLSKYFKKGKCRGRKGYDRCKLLKVALFAYMLCDNDLRSMESLCRYDIRFMYIMGEERPSFMAFERLLKDYLVKNIDEIFFELSNSIGALMKINKEIQYIDGTKLEADAGKYTFVYKTRIINARKKLWQKISDSIADINKNRGLGFNQNEKYCAQEIGYIVQYLFEIMKKEDIEPVYGRGKRKTEIQRSYDEFLKYYEKLLEYEYWLDIIDERNSCSKTDHDATMCATKMDYYCNTGLSRPCYNAQIAVSDGVIVNAELYQRPADSKTFIPFMERYNEYNGEYPKHPMADAGYGSFENYMYCTDKKMELDMKYSMYAKKNEPKYKKNNKYNPLLWEMNEQGYKVCPNGYVFNQYLNEKYNEDGKYLRIIQLYENKEKCGGCQFKENCLKRRKGYKTVSRDVVLNEFYAEVDKNLSTEQGKEMKKQRSIQVEGAFGVIKQDMRFTRFTRRGLKNTRMEFLLVCIGYNLRKYHNFRIKNKKKVVIN